MERREITIQRNIVETAIMAVKDFIKKNRKLVLYSLLGIVLIFAFSITGFVFYESRERGDLERLERIMERYGLDKRSSGDKAGASGGAAGMQAIEELRSLVSSSSWGFVKNHGSYYIAGLYYDNKKFNEAREYYLKFASDNPKSDFTVLAMQKAGVSAEHLGLYGDALKTYQEMESKYAETPYVEQVYYDLARMYQKKGDLFKSKEYYHKLMTQHPRSVFSARARHRLFLLSYQEKNLK